MTNVSVSTSKLDVCGGSVGGSVGCSVGSSVGDSSDGGGKPVVVAEVMNNHCILQG